MDLVIFLDCGYQKLGKLLIFCFVRLLYYTFYAFTKEPPPKCVHTFSVNIHMAVKLIMRHEHWCGSFGLICDHAHFARQNAYYIHS